MTTFFPGASGLMINGGTFNASTTNIVQLKRGLDILMDWVATDAFHNSKELYDAPKCHPHTRVAVLANIMKWVIKSEVEDEFMMWLFGPAGAGKSAIAKKIAELAAEKGLIIGSFFFSRTSSTRSTQDRLIPTLAYQMALSMPATRTHIQHAIETDPAIFHKDIRTQIDTLLMKPFQFASAQTTPCPKLLIIDGLDECNDRKSQVAILDAISHSLTTHKLPIRCLVVSRPEIDLAASFNGKEPLKSIHRRLALDGTYHPDDDIRRFLSDKFEEMRGTHRLRSTFPIPWPTEEALDKLVRKSSGQFIFAATVVRFVESNRHRPDARLNIILGISPPGIINPFSELDALYKQILSSVDDIWLTLRVLSFYLSSPHIVCEVGGMSEQFLSLEEGDIDRALIDLSSIVSYKKFSGENKFSEIWDKKKYSDEVKFLHASFVDFLTDKHRSDEFYIDMASARTDWVCCTLQYIKGPDGIRAGDRYFFTVGMNTDGCILNAQLRNEMLNFDLDAFMTAATRCISPCSPRSDVISWIFFMWMDLISEMGVQDGDRQLLIHRYRNSFEWRIQKYQSDWRLRLLLTFAPVIIDLPLQTPVYRRLDILLEMEDHLRLIDQNALDLRYSNEFFPIYIGTTELRYIMSHYVDGDSYASAALHCMHFLSNPPKYNASAEIGVTEWMETCHMALRMLCSLLKRAKFSPELVQSLSDLDINTTVKKSLPDKDIRELDTNILSFLSRGDVCVNWRIISEIRRALSANNESRQSELSEENDSDFEMCDLAKEPEWDMCELVRP